MKKQNVAWVALIIACMPLIAKIFNQVVNWIAEFRAIKAGLEAEPTEAKVVNHENTHDEQT